MPTFRISINQYVHVYVGKHGGGRRGGAIQRARTRWHGWQEEEEEEKKTTPLTTLSDGIVDGWWFLNETDKKESIFFIITKKGKICFLRSVSNREGI